LEGKPIRTPATAGERTGQEECLRVDAVRLDAKEHGSPFIARHRAHLSAKARKGEARAEQYQQNCNHPRYQQLKRRDAQAEQDQRIAWDCPEREAHHLGARYPARDWLGSCLPDARDDGGKLRLAAMSQRAEGREVESDGEEAAEHDCDDDAQPQGQSERTE